MYNSDEEKYLYYNEKKRLTEYEAGGMTVNERLFVLGLIDEFYLAVQKGNRETMTSILEKAFLTANDIEKIVAYCTSKYADR